MGRPVVAVLLAVAAFNLVTTSDFSAALAEHREVSVAGLSAPLTDGQPPVVGAIRDQVPGPQLGFASRERRWLLFDRDLAHYILDYARSRGRGPVVAFASRHRLLNTNSVGLAALLWWGKDIAFAQLSGDLGADTPAAYAGYLSAPEHGQPNVLLTTNDTRGDFPPVVTQPYAEQAARGLGFHLIRTTTQPDGRRLRLWWLDRGPTA
jgi:hypothetical protein